MAPTGTTPHHQSPIVTHRLGLGSTAFEGEAPPVVPELVVFGVGGGHVVHEGHLSLQVLAQGQDALPAPCPGSVVCTVQVYDLQGRQGLLAEVVAIAFALGWHWTSGSP